MIKTDEIREWDKNSLLLGISPIIKQALDAAYIICEFADTEYDRYLEYHLK